MVPVQPLSTYFISELPCQDLWIQAKLKSKLNDCFPLIYTSRQQANIKTGKFAKDIIIKSYNWKALVHWWIWRRYQQVKFINEKKGRVMVLHIENFTKPLYWVFPKRLYSDFSFLFIKNKFACQRLPCSLNFNLV